jgi:RES domain-containing protein
MILWRISNYATLDGSGGLYASGRWHTRGQLVLYCTWNPATALLESLVHLEIDAEDRPERFQLLKIEGPDGLSLERIELGDLPPRWNEDVLATQEIGDRWLAKESALFLEVPSALVPETWNLLVNPRHRQFDRLEIAAVYEHAFDARFFS